MNANSAVDGRTSEAPHVLVVDDDDDVRTLVQELLAQEGYSSAAVPNGQLALEWLRSSTDAPSIILLDLMMPQMDGWEFLECINKEPTLSGIPVAIMSAHPSVRQDFDNRPTHFGAFFLLPKPIDLSRLLAIVAGAVPQSDN
jgi:two-component system nitrogen regulation response regulator NtrX